MRKFGPPMREREIEMGQIDQMGQMKQMNQMGKYR